MFRFTPRSIRCEHDFDSKVHSADTVGVWRIILVLLWYSTFKTPSTVTPSLRCAHACHGLREDVPRARPRVSSTVLAHTCPGPSEAHVPSARTYTQGSDHSAHSSWRTKQLQPTIHQAVPKWSCSFGTPQQITASHVRSCVRKGPIGPGRPVTERERGLTTAWHGFHQVCTFPALA